MGFGTGITEKNIRARHAHTAHKSYRIVYTPKNYHLFKVVENRMQQCCVAYIVHSCQRYCSALLNLNQPAIRCNNAVEF